jgi:hypothetical protein
MFSVLLSTASILKFAAGPSPGFNSGEGLTKYAAFSVLNFTSPSFEVFLGEVRKNPTGPVFRATEPWEHSIDNGYSSVLYDETDQFGLGVYRVYYSASDKSFGGNIPGESSGAATLYATSKDGLVFEKPSLHRVNFNNSTSNNILFDGTTAVAIYDDSWHEKNASSRFKVWGNLPGLLQSSTHNQRSGKQFGSRLNHTHVEIGASLGFTAQLAGSAISSNGLNFTDYRRLQNPSRLGESGEHDYFANGM